jgi:hypothetical protein
MSGQKSVTRRSATREGGTRQLLHVERSQSGGVTSSRQHIAHLNPGVSQSMSQFRNGQIKSNKGSVSPSRKGNFIVTDAH